MILQASGGERSATGRDALRAIVARPRSSDTRLYWLLDQSALPQKGWLASRLGQVGWLDLLTGSSETRLDGATPLLTTADGRSTEANLHLVDELHRVGRFANAISLLCCRRHLGDLQAALQQRTRVGLPGSLGAVLRYFDTRTLPLLPRLFTPVQYARFTHGVDRWLYLDRHGELRELPCAESDAATQAACEPARLDLDDAQEALLIADGTADAVVDFFLTQEHSALIDRTPPEQYDLVEPLVAAARSIGLCEFREAVAFVGRALSDGVDFLEREPWRTGLDDYRQQRCSIEEALG